MRTRTAARFVRKLDRVLMESEGIPEPIERILMQVLPTLDKYEEQTLKWHLQCCESTAKAHRTMKNMLANFLTDLDERI